MAVAWCVADRKFCAGAAAVDARRRAAGSPGQQIGIKCAASASGHGVHEFQAVLHMLLSGPGWLLDLRSLAPGR